MLSLFRPRPKDIFSIHDPTGLHYLFQLRVELSPLKCHKKRHNFVDTPSDLCECGIASEDTSHFLFSCHLFARQRAALASSVIIILQSHNLTNLANDTKLYLYGHETLNPTENKNILLSTIRFIKSTERFSLNLPL